VTYYQKLKVNSGVKMNKGWKRVDLKGGMEEGGRRRK